MNMAVPLSPPSAPTIEKWMTPFPHCVGKDQSLAVAHRLMRTFGVRHLPVLDGGRLVGLLSQRDLYFLETIAGVDAETALAEEAMSPEVYCVRRDTSIEEAAREMAKHRYGCAVVMEGGRPVGIFSAADGLEFLARTLAKAR